MDYGIRTPRATRYRLKGHDGALIDIPGIHGRGYFVKADDIDGLIDELADIADTITNND